MCCGNIGGGGFMIIYFVDGIDIFINFCEIVFVVVSVDMYLDKEGKVIKDVSLYGYLVVGVSGIVLGMDSV